MTNRFERLAIVNRGESAMRLLNAVPEFNLEHGLEIRSIALYTETDRHAWFVREADEAVSLGPATFEDPTDGSRKPSYLDLDRLERALTDARVDAVWVGWGFVAESADFAELCERLGIVFVGPDSATIRRLGDKIASKRLAEEAGVQVLPWGGEPAETYEQAEAQASALGFPLLVKSAAGGGGRGIRRVESPDDLRHAFDEARAEALHSFGDPTVFLEKLIGDARHVEVQVISDGQGTVWAVGTRDCSVQRRNQKVLEESRSTAMTDKEDRAVRDAAERLCRAAGYRNAGTVEFLFVPETRESFFMEVNTRLQVEHPVTEITTGVDLVKLQLHIARGGKLEGDPPPSRGHAIEARVNAEDPEQDFLPAPGQVMYLRPPSGPGIRVETGVSEGDEIAPEFDSMIAKVIAWGRDRGEALARLKRAIARATIVIEGGTTNKSFLLGLLGNQDVIDGDVDTGWLDRLAAVGDHLVHDHAEAALLQAAIEAYDAEGAIEQTQFSTSAARGRPKVSTEPSREFSLRYGSASYEVRVARRSRQQYRVTVDGTPIETTLERLGPFERRLEAGASRHHIVAVTQGARHLIEVDGVAHTVARDDGGVVRAPAPAVVVSLAVEPGQKVETGDPVVVVEAMKMETAVVAPFDGTVTSILVREGVQVDAGAPLVELEQAAATPGSTTPGRLDFSQISPPDEPTSTDERCSRLFDDLHAQISGYDADHDDLETTVAGLAVVCQQLGTDHQAVVGHEMASLGLFADICALTRRRPDLDAETNGATLSAQDHLHAYLRAPDRATEALPDRFRSRLESALAHYGVTSLERSEELDEALLWMYKSRQRLPQFVPAVAAILERQLERSQAPATVVDQELRPVLDRLIAATENRFDVVADRAREVRYSCFDKPLLDEARRRLYGEMGRLLDALASDTESADRDDIMSQLISCPQPLAGALLDRFGAADLRLQQLLLEVLIRRFYRIRTLEGLEKVDLGGHAAITTEYDYDGDRIALAAIYGDIGGLPQMVDAVRAHVADVDPSHQPVVEFYLRWDRAPIDSGETCERIVDLLTPIDSGRSLRRVDVAVLASRQEPVRPTQYFTFRSSPSGLAEERRFRNLHPMLGKRNDLWRLANFEIDRLGSADDVYLFKGVAHENPDDERLFALAEVRDLTPVLDDEGTIVALPDLERMLMESLTAIRHHQAQLPTRRRYFWNQVILHVRPPWTIPPDDWRRLARKLAPATRGLGLEKTMLRIREADGDQLHDVVLEVTAHGSQGLTVTRRPPSDEAIAPLTPYRQTVVKTTRRGSVYPYELIRMLTPANDAESSFPTGSFQEYDLDDEDSLVPVDRPPGENTANLVVGVIRNETVKHPEGMERVILLGDPSKSLGSLAEPECRRIMEALSLARQRQLPVEWFALSSGAKISMTSGTENMDWIGAVLRGLIEFTQAGGEVNVIVTGVNVGGQPYWNAEATMLMHTKGILVMTPESAMVLTGKEALDFSGGVSAEDNFGIGGFDPVMGPNGQAQYFAADLAGASDILFAHYEHTYVAPGERFPRRAATIDSIDRDVSAFPHPSIEGSDFTTVGEIFSQERNPERKKPFDIRTVMRSVTDADHEPPRTLEEHAPRRHLGGLGCTRRRHSGRDDRIRVACGAAPGIRARRRPRRLDERHPVPDVVEEDCTCHQRCQRKPAGGDDGELVRVRRFPGVVAATSARIRCRDRSSGNQLRRPDGVLRGLSVPRRRVRRVLQIPERTARDRGDRRITCVGDRRRTCRRRRLRTRRRRPHRRGRAGLGPQSPARRLWPRRRPAHRRVPAGARSGSRREAR